MEKLKEFLPPSTKETVVWEELNTRRLPEGKYWLGMVRATTTNRKTQYVAEHSLIDGFPYPDYARALLKYLLQSRVSPRAITFSPPSSPPLFCKPTKTNEEYVYLDLRSAYPTILAYFYPCIYNRGKYLTLAWEDAIERLSFVLQLPKNVRVSAFGIAVSNRAMLYSKQGQNASILSVRTANPLANFSLQRLAYDYLQAIAVLIKKECQPIYIHTDGYILPAPALPRAESILSEFWLGEWKVKAKGDAEVKGVGIYRVGSKATAHFGKAHGEKPFSNLISEEEALTILSQIKKASKHLLPR